MATFTEIHYDRKDYTPKFSEFLEILDPSITEDGSMVYDNTSLEGTTAFERQLFRFLKDRIEYISQFYQNEMTTLLFAEWIRKNLIDAGWAHDMLYTEMCCECTTTDDFDLVEKVYRKHIRFDVSSNIAELRNQLRIEGREIQQMQIRQILDTLSGNNSTQAVKIHKFPTANAFRMNEERLAKIAAAMYPYRCTHILLPEELFWRAASSERLYHNVDSSRFDMKETASFSTPLGTVMQAPFDSYRTAIAFDSNVALIRKSTPEIVSIDIDTLIDKKELRFQLTSGYGLLCPNAVKIFQF